LKLSIAYIIILILLLPLFLFLTLSLFIKLITVSIFDACHNLLTWANERYYAKKFHDFKKFL